MSKNASSNPQAGSPENAEGKSRIPDPERRRIIGKLAVAAAIAVPSAKLLLADEKTRKFSSP